VTEDLRQRAGVDRHVLPRADPRLRLLAVAGLLQLAEDAREAAVLLQQLQQHHKNRALGLPRHLRLSGYLRLSAAHHSAHHLP
jgi:hypothetical protein